jgi:rhodanese-related sulfurtransferase
MHATTKLGLGVLIGAGLAAFALWWLADHNRGIAWAIRAVRHRFPDVSHLSAFELDAWLRDKQRRTPQIVDVRSEEEFATSHLPNALHLSSESPAAKALSVIDQDSPIVLYCSAGYRGATIGRRLKAAGCTDVWNLEGGIFAWSNAGLPLERAGKKTRFVHPYSRFFRRLLKP